MIRHKAYICIALSMMILLLSSCSSSRKTARTEPEHPHGPIIKPQNPDKKTEHDSKKMSSLIDEARKWLGTKYRYGGHSRSGTDCSGMVMELYHKIYGIKLPRTSREQQQYCTPVDRGKLQKGDLLFFSSSKNSRSISHVGLYIGNNEMIHASSSRGVIVSNINEKYYITTFRSSGRVITDGNASKKSNRDKDVRRKSVPSVRLEDLIGTKIDSIYSTLTPEQ